MFSSQVSDEADRTKRIHTQKQKGHDSFGRTQLKSAVRDSNRVAHMGGLKRQASCYLSESKCRKPGEKQSSQDSN